jgi:hypothetical protein
MLTASAFSLDSLSMLNALWVITAAAEQMLSTCTQCHNCNRLNLRCGAQTRISAAFAALLTLFILLVAAPALALVPVSGFAGLMFGVALTSFEWGSVWMILASALPLTARRRLLRQERQLSKVNFNPLQLVQVLEVVL